MTNEQNYIRTMTDEINRDLSMMPVDYQKGHRKAMEHALNLFQIWFPEQQSTQIENRWAKNTFKS